MTGGLTSTGPPYDLENFRPGRGRHKPGEPPTIPLQWAVQFVKPEGPTATGPDIRGRKHPVHGRGKPRPNLHPIELRGQTHTGAQRLRHLSPDEGLIGVGTADSTTIRCNRAI